MAHVGSNDETLYPRRDNDVHVPFGNNIAGHHRDDLKCVIDMCLSLKLWLTMASVENTFWMDLVAVDRILKRNY
jgi:hypothetical protein